MDGGEGDDQIEGDRGSTAHSTGNDVLLRGPGEDIIHREKGDDPIDGDDDDVIDGGLDHDIARRRRR